MEQNNFHTGFVSAMKLELSGEADRFDFQSGLSTKQDDIIFDLMISKKESSKKQTDHMGPAFTTVNLYKYLSTDESLNIGRFYKIMTSAQSFIDEHRSSYGLDYSHYSLSIVCDDKPYGILSSVRLIDSAVKKFVPGFYEIIACAPFRIQIIATSHLNDSHPWLGSLTKKASASKLNGIMLGLHKLDCELKALAIPVIETFVRYNPALIKRMETAQSEIYKNIKEIFSPDHLEETTNAASSGRVKIHTT